MTVRGFGTARTAVAQAARIPSLVPFCGRVGSMILIASTGWGCGDESRFYVVHPAILVQPAKLDFGDALIGTPATIADQMEQWLLTPACDGFNVMFPYLPGGLDDFVDRVVPELQRRGVFRRAYSGRTLRENLGLPRPVNRFFPG